MTRPRVQSRSSSLTWRISGESEVLPGQHHTRTGIPSRVTAIPTMTWGRSSRESLDLPWRAEPRLRRRARRRLPGRRPARRPAPPSGAAVRSLSASVLDDAAVLVAPDRLVGLLGLEVGAGGVEEDQVDFEVEQVRHRRRTPRAPAAPRTLISQSIAR